MITYLDTEAFLQQAEINLVLDVRSPAEFEQAHIPGAHNLALFSNKEREVIGTAYKKQSREIAIKIGLDFWGPKMRPTIEAVEKLLKNKPYSSSTGKPTILLHCWRGGMRSAAVAWLLSFYGYEVQLLQGGYKAYRNWVLQQFSKPYNFAVLGGFTGSGKTEILKELFLQGTPIIDLEGLANHKGSAFGNLNQIKQPSQEQFENLLATKLYEYQETLTHFFIEDESKRIGNLNIPNDFWETMRQKKVYFLEIPFQARLAFIIKHYAHFSKESIIDAINRINKRLGPLQTKLALASLQNNDYTACFNILLQYYDKFYSKGLENRENAHLKIITIPCTAVDEQTNTKKLLACFQ